ncbi:MAG: uridine kinase [Oscillospiraceae bacterium]|nr:uridine kinase [Oscillospiraceae bacterium]
MVDRIIEAINGLLEEKERVIIAIDGRCASGKTTLAYALKSALGCNVLHMDDFFLRPEQRTKGRLETPGENIDHERFLSEVLKPLKKGEEFYYRPFNCSTLVLDEPVFVPKNKITVIEGSYSCNKALWDYYDLRLFLTVSPEEQMKRIVLRDGKEYSKVFESKWIPLEESYFKAYDIAARCDFILQL